MPRLTSVLGPFLTAHIPLALCKCCYSPSLSFIYRRKFLTHAYNAPLHNSSVPCFIANPLHNGMKNGRLLTGISHTAIFWSCVKFTDSCSCKVSCEHSLLGSADTMRATVLLPLLQADSEMTF